MKYNRRQFIRTSAASTAVTIIGAGSAGALFTACNPTDLCPKQQKFATSPVSL